MYHRRIPRKIFIVGPIKVHKVHKVTLANVSIHESPIHVSSPTRRASERTEFIRWFRADYYFTTLNRSSSVGFTRINVAVP